LHLFAHTYIYALLDNFSGIFSIYPAAGTRDTDGCSQANERRWSNPATSNPQERSDSLREKVAHSHAHCLYAIWLLYLSLCPRNQAPDSIPNLYHVMQSCLSGKYLQAHFSSSNLLISTFIKNTRFIAVQIYIPRYIFT